MIAGITSRLINIVASHDSNLLTLSWQFSPEHADVEFHEQQPGHYEQVLARKSECDTNAVFSIFPDIHEYKTSDLMERHPDPSKSDFYKFTGRTDDLIAFSNAAKFSPLAYEEHILGNHLVKAAIMVGIQRPCAALLLELADSDMSKDEALEKVWPTVENANTAAPKHAQVRKEMVLIATKEKPFERASKETPIRGRTLELYEDEINAIYDRYGENWQTRNGNIGKV